MSRLCSTFLLVFCVANLFARQSLVRTFLDRSGQLIDEITIPDIPVEQRVPGPIAIRNRSAVMVNNVPTYDWCYGCSATSAAMMAGYYDRRDCVNIYSGTTNNGVMPLDNSVWGAGECPLSATHTGIDNLTTLGHVNRFWVAYGDSLNDPFGTGNPTSTYANCTADFMGTSQDWWHNSDGSTTFYYNNNGSALSNYTTCESETP